MQTMIRLKMGNVVVAAAAQEGCPPLRLGPAHRLFLAAPDGPADVVLQVHYGELPEVDFQEKVFECDGPWSLYRCGENLVLAMISPVGGGTSNRLVILKQDLSGGKLYLDPDNNPLTSESPGAAPGIDPFEYPLDEVLLINYLARWRQGLIIHALGLVDDGRGLAFCGVSGAGKSTLARLWQKTAATLLSDDRLILRPEGDRVWMFGTPWHGDARIASPQSVPLERLCFLAQAPKNYLSPLTPLEAATRLLVRCFPPFYDHQGMANTLEIINRVVTEIPCFELGFVPDESVVDFIRGQHEAG
jgi:hypothetical protein